MKGCAQYVALGVLLSSTASSVNAQGSFLDHTCPGGQQTCSDDATCCLMSENEGYMCCLSTAAGPCCGGHSAAGGGCCTEGETCCEDDKDYSCCMQQSTYCVVKDPSVPSLPARCCPRWTVGCTTGSVGCCDPAQPWQWFLPSSTRGKKSVQDGEVPAVSTPSTSIFANGTNVSAYALVVDDGAIISGLTGWVINVATGQIESKKHINKAFDDDPAGESTREFMFDSKRKLFYYVDANFTANGGPRPAGGREMYLYTVDPVAGTTDKQTVQGAVDFPVGYSYHPETDAIILGVEKLFSNDTVAGFDFFSLNPETAVATRLSTIDRGAGESDPAYYSGYHRHTDVEGKTLYRLGFEMVKEQTGQGLGLLALNEAHASATWQSEVSPLHDYYMTLNRMPASSALVGNGTNVFVSLAPEKSAIEKHDLDLVQWSPEDGGKSAKTLTKFENAHVPSVLSLGSLGYLASAVSGDTFVAIVQHDSKLPNYNTWALAVADLTDPGAVAGQVLPLEPTHLSGTASISGLGLA